MPASRFTKKARGNPKATRAWDHAYQSVKKAGGSPGKAVRVANAAAKKSARKRA